MSTKKQPLFVIVCGGSGSGKTTFTKLVCKEIDKKYSSQIISLDNFYIPVPDNKLLNYNFDRPEALNWDLIIPAITNLTLKKSCQIPNYSFKTHNYTTYDKVTPTDIIIVEGIFALSNPLLKKLANLTIYLDVADDERFIRRLSRDIHERNKPVQENIDQWRNTVIQAHYAYVDPYKKAVDLVIPWNRQNDAVVTACSGAIINLLEKRK